MKITHFLDQAAADFQQSLDSIETPELDTSFGGSDVITSSDSYGYLCWVSTVLVTSKLQLAPSIRSHELLCQGRALLSSVSLATKISASKLIKHFSNHPAAFGFSLQHYQITSPWILKIGRLFRVFLKFRLALVWLLKPLSIWINSFLTPGRVAPVNTISFLCDSEGKMISVSEVHELLTKIYDILDNAVSKQVGNTASFLAHF